MTEEAEALIKKRYFELFRNEIIGETPEITKELDHIERVLECERVLKSAGYLSLPSGHS